jgi:hypothetical protein
MMHSRKEYFWRMCIIYWNTIVLSFDSCFVWFVRHPEVKNSPKNYYMNLDQTQTNLTLIWGLVGGEISGCGLLSYNTLQPADFSRVSGEPATFF